jgi:FkbM family methyltransferase
MSDHTKSVTLEITGNTKVSCPADIGLMTPFILVEQRDWFEDEIRFLRQVVRPDDVIVDIGANFGLYSLSLAKICAQGHVWSYEPCASTAQHLRTSIQLNGYSNASVLQMALSSEPGIGKLRNSTNSELNALTDSAEPGEEVELTALDVEASTRGWTRVDIVKIDAEGHELQVLDGGKEFFDTYSPLVMCEIKVGNKMDFGPSEHLINHGYQPYKLIPGLWALAPLELSPDMDDYRLNIFCCKPDRAADLHTRGRLITDLTEPDTNMISLEGQWQRFAEQLPYTREHGHIWSSSYSGARAQEDTSLYSAALNYYALAQSQDISIDVRYGALLAAFRLLAPLSQDDASLARQLSYVRVAIELGERRIAVNKLLSLVAAFERSPGIIGEEPFLSPSREFDHIPPQGRIANWVFAATLDSFEKLRTFSSYFSHPQLTLNVVSNLKALGFCSVQMEVRGKLASNRVPTTLQQS